MNRTILLAETINTTNRTVNDDGSSEQVTLNIDHQQGKETDRGDTVGVEINLKMNRIGDNLGDDDDVFLWVEEDANNEKTDNRRHGRDDERAQSVHGGQNDERVLVKADERMLSEWKYWGESSTSSKGGKSSDSVGASTFGNASTSTSKSSKRCRRRWKARSQGGGMAR